MRRSTLIALCTCLALPTVAEAQVGGDIPVPAGYGQELDTPVPTELRPPSELMVQRSAWPDPPPDFPDRLRDPERGTEPDDGIVLNGLGFFIGAYLSGLSSTLPMVVASDRGSGEFAAFSFVPFAQWAVGFYDTSPWGLGPMLFIIGGVFTFMQTIAALVIVAGLAHHRDVLRARRVPGQVLLTSDGVGVAF